MSNEPSALGPLVRLAGLSISQLPPGAKSDQSAETTLVAAGNKSDTTSFSDIESFVTAVLKEAIPFIDDITPESGAEPTWKSKGIPKSYSHSQATVQLYERTVTIRELKEITGLKKDGEELNEEYWPCRKSCHANKSEKGTASWEEFVHHFKETHATSEQAFTPSVIGVREVMKWDTTNLVVDILGERWDNVTVVLQEIKHKLEAPLLKNRIFPVLQIAASLEGAEEFMVVQIPINDLEKSPSAVYTKESNVVVAAYVAVERVRIVPVSGEVEWLMATASDAKGILPKWVQKVAVPGAIAKDVDMFLHWIAGQRGKENENQVSPKPIAAE